MTRAYKIVPMLLSCVLLGACAGGVDCTKPQAYQQARPGTHVEVPAGLNPLPADREVTVPQASPGAPPPPGDCLDSPPTLRTTASES
ncbi:MAG: hypothetical protein WBN23_10230 [Woeseia sp.]